MPEVAVVCPGGRELSLRDQHRCAEFDWSPTWADVDTGEPGKKLAVVGGSG